VRRFAARAICNLSGSPAFKALLLVVVCGLGTTVLAPGAGAVTTPSYALTAGGPGHAVMYPSGLDVDAQGNVYVADTGGDAVAAYNASGTRLWQVGERGPKTLQQFLDPRDVAYLAGLVYVADTGNHRVVVLDAVTGAGSSSWSTGSGNPLGISAGVDGARNPPVLVTLDNSNSVGVYSPDGNLMKTIGGIKGSGPGELTQPRDAATNASGDVYVADFFNNRIVQFAANGSFIRTWGSTGGGNGKFARPYGVDVDDDGNVYVADSNNHRIQKFDPTGTFLAKWGTPGAAPGQFTGLRRVAVGPGPAPQIYGADLWAYRIERFDPTLGYQQSWGSVPPADGLYNEPSGVSVLGSSLFVVDAVNQRVVQHTTDGTFVLQFGHRGWGIDLSGLNWPRDLAVDPITGNVWVADTKNSRLLEFAPNGSSTGRSIGSMGSGSGQFFWPLGLTLLGHDLLVADTNNNRVVRIDPTGPTVVWTANGMKAPSDVTVAGNTVYVADTGNKRVALLNVSTGSLKGTITGNATRPWETLHSPQGVAVAANGDVWVSDSSWARLMAYDSLGTFVQRFGSKGTGPMEFSNPTKLEIAGGRLYVADQWNDRVQVFNLG
jgi:tripartite motif-containing protein 71